MNSLSILVLAAICASALCDGHAEWLENSKQCSQKQNVNIDDVKKVMTGEIKPDLVTPSMKCYFLCMSEKEGITKDGVLQPQALADKIANSPNKEEFAKAVTSCKDVKGTDSCDTSFKIMSCIGQYKGSM